MNIENQNETSVQQDLLTRRAWLTKGFRTAAALGLGAIALNAAGDLNPFAAEALNNFSSNSASDLNFTSSDVCTLTCAATEGPCYTNLNLVRRNIAADITGLPLRFGFRVVNAATCLPIQNASVEIWHADKDGNYSALSPTTTICTKSSTTQAQNFGRGIQTTDANGWAYFDSVFPGWYSSRSTHVHFRIKLNSTSVVTSQLFFADRVDDFVYKNHPLYISRPNRDTTNATDNVIGGAVTRYTPYLFSTKFVNNRFVQAVKTIAVNTTATTCSV